MSRQFLRYLTCYALLAPRSQLARMSTAATSTPQLAANGLPIEDVWQYPRPPLIEPANVQIDIDLNGRRIVSTKDAIRICETTHPPVYYLPQSAFAPGVLKANKSHRQTYCEWKGIASYYDLVVNGKSYSAVAWTYESPTKGYELISSKIAIYPSVVDAYFVNGEKGKPQEGSFYGGLITSNLRGKFKGGAGTYGW